MTIIKGCIIAAIALAAGAAVETARADEAYVCDQGRVVYVKPGELEIKKQQDPCIARYFDNVPSDRSVAKSAAATRGSATPQPATLIVETPPAPAPAKAVVAAVSDFRNVRIINPGPDSDGWFRHRR